MRRDIQKMRTTVSEEYCAPNSHKDDNDAIGAKAEGRGFLFIRWGSHMWFPIHPPNRFYGAGCQFRIPRE